MDKKEIKILNFLKKLGVPQNIKGHEAIKTAILLTLEDKAIAMRATKRMYPEVAQRLNSTASKVERPIRYAKELAYDNAPVELLDEIFGYTINANKGVPSNSHFITAIVEFLQQKGIDER